MDYLSEFLSVFGRYSLELVWVIAGGFLISGFVYEFLPTHFIDRHLGRKNIHSILIATLFGAMLPVCCFGTLPIAVTLRRKGAQMGPVLAFLIATPATSISALVVSWKLLGMTLTVYLSLVIVVMGVAMGLIANALKLAPVKSDESDCCHREDDCCGTAQHAHEVKLMTRRLSNVFHYAFVTLPKAIGLELLIAVAVASFLMSFEPVQNWLYQFLVGWKGYFILLTVGLFDYVCSTASVPLADALLKVGATEGQAIIYLLFGPITSYGTLLVLRKEFGWNILWIYLAVLSIFSLTAGIGFDFLKSVIRS